MMREAIAELFGTFVLVFAGTGASGRSTTPAAGRSRTSAWR